MLYFTYNDSTNCRRRHQHLCIIVDKMCTYLVKTTTMTTATWFYFSLVLYRFCRCWCWAIGARQWWRFAAAPSPLVPFVAAASTPDIFWSVSVCLASTDERRTCHTHTKSDIFRSLIIACVRDGRDVGGNRCGVEERIVRRVKEEWRRIVCVLIGEWRWWRWWSVGLKCKLMNCSRNWYGCFSLSLSAPYAVHFGIIYTARLPQTSSVHL